MSCFGVRSSCGCVRGRESVRDDPPSAAIFAEALRALPIRVEITSDIETGASQLIYCNRTDERGALRDSDTRRHNTTTVRLSQGLRLTYWSEASSGTKQAYSHMGDADVDNSIITQETSRLVALRSILDDIPGMAFVAPARKTTTSPLTKYVNARYAIYHGISPGEVSVPSVYSSLVHPDDAPRTIEALEKSLRDGSECLIEHRRRRATDGAFAWLRLQASAVRDSAGKVVAIMGLM
jgi:PAS domain S-box-containing protein